MRRDFHDASHNGRASFASLPKRDLSLNVRALRRPSVEAFAHIVVRVGLPMNE